MFALIAYGSDYGWRDRKKEMTTECLGIAAKLSMLSIDPDIKTHLKQMLVAIIDNTPGD